jgi:predicted nucleotidyltransferase
MSSVIHVIGDVGERMEAARQAEGVPPPRPLRERVIEMLHAHRAELERMGVRSVSLFGSVARGEPGPHSDVDVLVDYVSGGGMFEFIGVLHYLEDHLHRPVDLVSRDGLRPGIRRSVEADAVLVWSAADQDATVSVESPTAHAERAG